MSLTKQVIVLCWADGVKIKEYLSMEDAAKDNDMTVERVEYFIKRGRGPVCTFQGKYFLVRNKKI